VAALVLVVLVVFVVVVPLVVVAGSVSLWFSNTSDLLLVLGSSEISRFVLKLLKVLQKLLLLLLLLLLLRWCGCVQGVVVMAWTSWTKSCVAVKAYIKASRQFSSLS